MKKKKRLILLLIVLLCLFLEGVHLFLNANRTLATPIAGNETEPPSVAASTASDTVNIALFGIDTGREKHEAVHSDAIMILSIDKVHKKIKLSSFIRDTYVAIEGHKNNKLNTAYAIGGPELAVKTLNQNFDMDIQDYITVDFVGLSNIIDALDGVEVDIKKKEIDEINKYIKEIAEIKKVKNTPLKKQGPQVLNGIQATAYARIRNVGEGDFDRAERQKNVLSALFNKLKLQDVSKYPALVSSLMPYVKTSLSLPKIIGTGTDIIKLGLGDIDWYRFPLYGYCKGTFIDKVWYLTTDLNVTTDHLHQFVYNDVKVVPLKDSF